MRRTVVAALLLGTVCLGEQRFRREDDENEHFLDVKKLVRGTINAMGAPMNTSQTASPAGLYKLLQLPADIMTQLAADAGYIDTATSPSSSTSRKQMKKRAKKPTRYRKIYEDGTVDEATYVRVSDDEIELDSDEESYENAYKPRKKNKAARRHHSPIVLPRNYVPPPALTPAPMAQSAPMIAPLPPLPQLFGNPVGQAVPSFGGLHMLPVATTSAPVSPGLNIQPVPSVAGSNMPVIAANSVAEAQYAYQPIVQPDGKTYYQRVLILPPASATMRPPALIVTPMTTEPPTTTTPMSTSAFVTDAAPTTPSTTPSTTTTSTTTSTTSTTTAEAIKKRKPKIRRRLISSVRRLPTQQEPQSDPIAAAVQQEPLSDPSPSLPAAGQALPEVTPKMRPVAITFSPHLSLFKTATPESLVEDETVKPRRVHIGGARTHGARTHSVRAAIESEQTGEELEAEEAPEKSKLVTTQLLSAEEQAKKNEVFSAAFIAGTKKGGAVPEPQTSPLRFAAKEELAEDEEEAETGAPLKRKRITIEKQAVKKVESEEISELHTLYAAAKKSRTADAPKRRHDSTQEDEDVFEAQEEVTTPKPKRRRLIKKKVQRPVQEEEEDEEEETSVASRPPVASASTAAFRRVLAPALYDVREMGSDSEAPYASRRVHHAERLATLRKTLEAKARGVKQAPASNDEKHTPKEKEDAEEAPVAEDEEEEEEEEEEVEEPTTTTTTTRRPRRKLHRMRKNRKSTTTTTTTTEPTTTTTTTTTTTPTPEEREDKVSKESYEISDEDYAEMEEDMSYEVDDDGKPITKTTTTTTTRKPKTRRRKAIRRYTTTTEAPELHVLRQHCVNIRSFARQFGMANLNEFVEEHCSFIENYYPHLTCERREEYLEHCSRIWDASKKML